MAREIISGQIVLRQSCDKAPGPDDDRELMMVVGVIAVPKGLKLKGEHKYTLGSKPQASGIEGLNNMIDPGIGDRFSSPFKEINLVLYPETEEDISDETKGDGLGGIITTHNRWRV